MRNYIVNKIGTTYFIDGRCRDCGIALSKDYECFLSVDVKREGKEKLGKAIREEFLCFNCGFKKYKNIVCFQCKYSCTEREAETCYALRLSEGDYTCACPVR